jgi:hypothetical protein
LVVLLATRVAKARSPHLVYSLSSRRRHRMGALETKDIGRKLINKGLEAGNTLVERAVGGSGGTGKIVTVGAMFERVGTMQPMVSNAPRTEGAFPVVPFWVARVVTFWVARVVTFRVG